MQFSVTSIRSFNSLVRVFLRIFEEVHIRNEPAYVMLTLCKSAATEGQCYHCKTSASARRNSGSSGHVSFGGQSEILKSLVIPGGTRALTRSCVNDPPTVSRPACCFFSSIDDTCGSVTKCKVRSEDTGIDGGNGALRFSCIPADCSARQRTRSKQHQMEQVYKRKQEAVIFLFREYAPMRCGP